MEKTTKYKHTYISPDVCTFGDYGGAGTVGKSNVRVILKMADDEEWETDHIGYQQWDRIGGRYEWDTDNGDVYESDDPPKVVLLTGAYGSHTIWLLECPETADIIAALSDYSLLDEDDHSAQECEDETEAWDSWIRSDLMGHVDDEHPAHEWEDSKLFNAYRAAMETENEYPVHETGGCYVNVDRIKDAFVESLNEGASMD